MEFEHLDSNVQYAMTKTKMLTIQSFKINIIQMKTLTQEPDTPIRLQEAKKYLEALIIFFVQQGNERSLISTSGICSDYIRQQSLNMKKQSTIDHFFISKN